MLQAALVTAFFKFCLKVLFVLNVKFNKSFLSAKTQCNQSLLRLRQKLYSSIQDELAFCIQQQQRE